jgi:hypothetical protein
VSEEHFKNHGHLTDGERLIRIETVLRQVAHRMDDYIKRQETFQIEAREAIHAVEAKLPSAEEYGHMRKEVKELQALKNRAIGWVAAVVFASTLLWELFGPSFKFFKGGG